MAVERDLLALVVMSGGIRYEVRRPGRAWPVDEDLMAQILAEVGADLDQTEGPFPETPQGRTTRHRRRLRRLHQLGVIHYEEHPRARGF